MSFDMPRSLVWWLLACISGLFCLYAFSEVAFEAEEASRLRILLAQHQRTLDDKTQALSRYENMTVVCVSPNLDASCPPCPTPNLFALDNVEALVKNLRRELSAQRSMEPLESAEHALLASCRRAMGF
jgi:hypothetical protein